MSRIAGRRGRLCLIAASVALCAAAAAPAAQAGTYTIQQCRDVDTGAVIDGPAIPDGWTTQYSNNGQSYLTLTGSCQTGLRIGSDGVAGTMPGDPANPPTALLYFQAPADTTLAAWQVRRALQAPPAGTQSYFFWAQGGHATCWVNNSDCDAGTVGNPAAVNNLLSGTSSDGPLFGIGCNANSPACDRAAGTMFAELYAARLTLTDSEQPQLQSVSGTLLATGTVSGSKAVDVTASDTGGGLYKLTVTSSASPGFKVERVLDNGNHHCDTPTWTYRVPCPLSIGDSATVDTTRLPNGEQTLTIQIADVAGNTRSTTRTITVDNTPRTAPERVTPGTSTTTSPALAAPALDSCPPATVSQLAATPQRGATTGKVAPYNRSALTLAGRLLGGDGAPRADQTLAVVQTPLATGLTARPIGTVRTGPDGSFTANIPAGPSRSLNVTLDGCTTTLAAKATSQTVRGAMRLRVPRRHVRNRHSARFTGTLAGGFYGRGVPLELQVKLRGHWKDVKAARTTTKGTFRTAYRFTRTFRRYTYTFRVVTRAGGAWPYRTAASRPVKVTVN